MKKERTFIIGGKIKTVTTYYAYIPIKAKDEMEAREKFFNQNTDHYADLMDSENTSEKWTEPKELVDFWIEREER